MQWLRITFVPLAISIAFVSIAKAQSPRDIAEYASPSVVLIVTKNSKGKAVALGSGFCVQDNVLVTNYHVIRGAYQLYAKVVGKKDVYRVEKILAADSKKDLALLKVTGLRAPPLLIGDSSEVAVGDEVYAVGNPAGLEGTFSQGLISGIRQIAGNRYFQITAPISHGSSGGPILDKSGGVIAIAVATLNIGQNLNFGIPVSELKALMNRTIGLSLFTEEGASQSKKMLVLDASGLCFNEARLTKEYRANPNSPAAVFNLAEEYRKCYEPKAAAHGYEIVLRLKPDMVEAYFGLGASYSKLCSFFFTRDSVRRKHYADLAIKALKQAIAIKPDYVEAYVALGSTYRNMERLTEAIEAFKLGISIKPDYADAYFELGNAYYSPAARQQYKMSAEEVRATYGADLRKATTAFEEAIPLQANTVRRGAIYSNLSSAYQLLGQYQKAIEVSKEGIRKSSFRAGHRELYRAYRDSDQLVEGVEAFKELIRIKPDYDDAHYCLGSLYLDLGDKKLALEEYKILKTLKSDIWAKALLDEIFK